MSTHSRFPIAVCILAAGLVCGTTGPAAADVWYADIHNTSGLEDGTSWSTACRSIQQAVNYAAADGGGEVWVAEGTYTATTDPVLTMAANVDLYGGFAGTETARDQRDWAAHLTTIDGDDTRRCVNGADNATLDGFTVTRGKARKGGGMHNDHAWPMVTNCAFIENLAHSGGGMYNSFSSPSVTNCVFIGSSAEGSYGGGGGMYNTSSSPTVTSCTFSQNSAHCCGGGMLNLSSSPTATNCIFWGNSGGGITSSSSSLPTVAYSCIQGGHDGDGNISTDPLFWNSLAGDLRLHATSPCLDTGTASLAPDTDIRGISRPQGAGIDMGAYEMDEVDSDGEGLMDDFERDYSHTSADEPDSDGDGISDREAWFTFRVWYVNAASPVFEPDGTSWDTAFTDIQTAVDNAFIRGGGEIWVAQGSYTGTGENVATMHCSVHLYGGFVGTETERRQRDWKNHITTINGEETRRCVCGADNATLDGFTMKLGKADNGGGMYNLAASPAITHCRFSENSATYGGGMYDYRSSPAITDCSFSGNSAGFGGAMCAYYSMPDVTNCSFSGNFAEYHGGMYNWDSSPTVMNCTFSGNSAQRGGGMCNLYSAPTVTSCTFEGNFAEDEGGGMDNFSSSPVVTNCTFVGNSASGLYGGGGMFTSSSLLVVTNCTFAGNSASDDGGGMYNLASDLVVTNATFTGNSASSGGGMYNSFYCVCEKYCDCFYSSLTVTNSILWGNSGGEIYNCPSCSATVVSSCIQGGYDGNGNISDDPLFVDEAGGDLHLQYGSPCIDTGTAEGAPETDIESVSRPQGAGFDMGD